MVQVENEYGSFYACDHDYMDYLARIMEHYLGSETLLFTTDGNDLKLLECGTTKRAFATVDFGTGNGEHGLLFFHIIFVHLSYLMKGNSKVVRHDCCFS